MSQAARAVSQTVRPPTPSNRVVLITGGSTGIGWAAARALAVRGDTVVTVSRASGGGESAAARLAAETGGDVHFLPADLSLLAEARRVAAVFRMHWDRLDVLLLNAGAYLARRTVTPEGREVTWALNHLGGAVLALDLADRLLASTPSRIVLTSSGAARAGRMQWEDPELRQGYSGIRAYAQSKLANQLVTLALSRRLEGRGVSVHAFHPGFVATEFGGDAGPWTPLVRLTQRAFGRSPERGAETLVFLATDPAGVATTGQYWVDRRVQPMAPGASTAEAAERLWALTLRATGIDDEVLATDAAGPRP